MLVPATGPAIAFPSLFHHALSGSTYENITGLIDTARAPRDVFPSLHVGISFVVWLYAWRNSRRLFWILAPLILSLWVSTIYLRYHYLVDCLAGFILALLSYWLANWMFKRFGEIKVPLVLPSAWVARVRGAGVPD